MHVSWLQAESGTQFGTNVANVFKMCWVGGVWLAFVMKIEIS